MKFKDRLQNIIHYNERPEFRGRWFTGSVCPKELSERLGNYADTDAVIQHMAEKVRDTGFLYMFLKIVRSNIHTRFPYETRMIALIIDETGEEVRRFKEAPASEEKFLHVLKFCAIKHVIVRVIFFKDSIRFRIPLTFDFRKDRRLPKVVIR